MFVSVVDLFPEKAVSEIEILHVGSLLESDLGTNICAGMKETELNREGIELWHSHTKGLGALKISCLAELSPIGAKGICLYNPYLLAECGLYLRESMTLAHGLLQSRKSPGKGLEWQLETLVEAGKMRIISWMGTGAAQHGISYSLALVPFRPICFRNKLWEQLLWDSGCFLPLEARYEKHISGMNYSPSQLHLVLRQ